MYGREVKICCENDLCCDAWPIVLSVQKGAAVFSPEHDVKLLTERKESPLPIRNGDSLLTLPGNGNQ